MRKLLDALRVYGHKAPVNIPGAQQQAAKAYRTLLPFLSDEERRQLSVAVGHATGWTAEGRCEFDRVWKRIHQRLSAVFKESL